ncbi:MAG: Smr/MutS family protein [Rhizobiales bacterium]|nr:Smr/MutS family protein [Hyphomicrobiales bacterium]
MTPRRRRRDLSREEIELWRHVTQDVAPQPGAVRPAAPEAEAPAAPAAAAAKPAAPAPRAYPAAGYTPPAPAAAKAAPLNALGRALRQRIARGRAPIDGAIDLHGMRQAEAHHALHSFILRHHAQGSRVVLVVTGKGSRLGEAGEAGVLRRSAPHWLASADWRAMIVGFEQAGRGHGGDGALYVHLRRRRGD